MKRKTKAKKRVKARRKAKTKLPKMPKVLEKRVLEERPEKPEDVVVENDVDGDPVVRVRGKTVGAWIDL